MNASPDIWARLLNDWRGLSQGARDNIIGGLVVVAITTVVAAGWRTLSKGWRRPSERTPFPSLPPPLPPVGDKSSSHDFPRLPAVAFVERSDKNGHSILSQLKDKLAPGNDRLIALWGSGGVGKTRLAIEAAHALRESFANRIVWVSADGRPDFTLSTLLDGIATQLNRADLRQLAPEPKQEQVCILVAASQALVILDNFETIAPAERMRCRDFLAQHVSCPALITTRHFIDSNFVDNISIEEMSDDEAEKFLDELVAQAPAHIKFDQPTRTRIIKTATAIPLVMQWVVQQIILTQRSQDVLNKLSQGKGSAAERVFDNSFDLPEVGDDGRAALLALALFTPSAARDALADVAGFGSDLERLNRAVIPLGSLRLVKPADGGERLTVEGLTRELALARLSEDSRSDEFRQRFIAYFLQYAESHWHKTPEDYDALEGERDNLLSATDAAFAREDWGSVTRMAYALAVPPIGMLFVRGYWDEALRVNGIALTAARSAPDEADIASFAHNAAIMYELRGELSEAGKFYNESLEIEKLRGNEKGVAISMHQLGMLAQRKGELDEARKLYDESLEIGRRLGYERGILLTTGQLGRLAQEQGNLSEARKLYGETLEVGRRIDDQSVVTAALHNLATIAQEQGELDEARRLYDESLEIAKRLGDQNGVASTLDGLGLLEKEEGNVAGAKLLLSESLSIFRRLGSPEAEIVYRHLEGLKNES